MTLKVASWNIEGRLSNLAVNQRGTPEHILRSIEALGADILFLAEAFGPEMLEERTKQRIVELGYDTYIVPYEEGGDVRVYSAVDAPSMILLSKVPFVQHETVRLADLRNAIVARIKDPETSEELQVIGVHLDDRSEELRLRQVPELVQCINESTLPTIVMGDFNAMHGEDLTAKLLRTFPMQIAARHTSPESVIRRVVGMAKGDTLRELIGGTGLREADPLHHPATTLKMRGQEWLPSIRLIQIDHILVSKDVQFADFHVAPDGGSDHRAISAMITLDK